MIQTSKLILKEGSRVILMPKPCYISIALKQDRKSLASIIYEQKSYRKGREERHHLLIMCQLSCSSNLGKKLQRHSLYWAKEFEQEMVQRMDVVTTHTPLKKRKQQKVPELQNYISLISYPSKIMLKVDALFRCTFFNVFCLFLLERVRWLGVMLYENMSFYHPPKKSIISMISE